MSKKSVLFFVGILFLFTACEKTYIVEPPDNFSAEVTGANTVKLRWTQPLQSFYGFMIERKLASDGEDGYQVIKFVEYDRFTNYTTQKNYETIDETGLKEGTSYTYRIFSRYIKLPKVYLSAKAPTATATMPVNVTPLPNISIGNQIWQSQNLDVTTYKNGDPIPQITNLSEWKAARSGAWCYYNFDAANGNTYGKIYNQYAVDDPRGLAPQGWRIPTSNDFYTLRDLLGGKSYAGQKMKSTTLWKTSTTPGAAGTNESKWNGLPGGRMTLGTNPAIDAESYFWTSTDSTFDSKKSRNSIFLYYGTGEMYVQTDTSMNMGNYVRCIRN